MSEHLLTEPDRLDVQVIGPLCIDINVDAAGCSTRGVGGAALCAAAAAASLGRRVEVVTTMADDDAHLRSRFPDAIERVVAVHSARTSSIRNVYTTADQERRHSSALAQADPITAADVPKTPVAVQHLAGLVVGDYAPGLLTELAARADLAVDMQGFLRRRDPETGALTLSQPPQDEGFYRRIRFLKVDTAEGEHLTGLTDRRAIARALHERGAQEVMVSNAREILVLDRDGAHVCPLRPRNLTGRTGRGDTVFSAYITERRRHDVDRALLTACAAVSLKMETPGPLVCTRSDVEAYRDRFYPDLAPAPEGEAHER